MDGSLLLFLNWSGFLKSHCCDCFFCLEIWKSKKQNLNSINRLIEFTKRTTPSIKRPLSCHPKPGLDFDLFWIKFWVWIEEDSVLFLSLFFKFQSSNPNEHSKRAIQKSNPNEQSKRTIALVNKKAVRLIQGVCLNSYFNLDRLLAVCMPPTCRVKATS